MSNKGILAVLWQMFPGHPNLLPAFFADDVADALVAGGRPAPAVAAAFDSVIADRKARGIASEVQYIGTRETALDGAAFDPQTGMGEVSVRFVGELIAAHRDPDGNIVDGDPKTSRKQRDVWTFARQMGSSDPNWQLVATA